MVFSVTLTWWSLMPRSPGLQTSGRPASRGAASHSNSIPENRPRPSESQELLGDRLPKLAAEVSEEESLERRCLQLAERDPPEAVILASDTRGSSTHPGLLENLVGQWATHDLQASYEWVLEQQPGELRDALMARVAFAGSLSDPAAAARIVTDEMTPGQKQTEAAISVLHQWALRDLNAAASWAFAFPEGPLRQRAVAEIEGVRKTPRTGGQ